MRYVSIALLLVAATAGAANWKQIANLDANGSVVLVDASTITEVKGFRRASIKSVYTTDQTIPDEYRAAMRNAPSFRSVESVSLFNCTERTSAVALFRWYDADDNDLGNFQLERLTFRDVPVGTPDEQVLEAACKTDAVKPQIPFSGQAKMVRPVSPDDYYPHDSIRRNEQGSPLVQVCVGPSGKLLRQPVITGSSGFPGLDGAAIRVAKGSRYAAGTKDGTALTESCVEFNVTFRLKTASGGPVPPPVSNPGSTAKQR